MVRVAAVPSLPALPAPLHVLNSVEQQAQDNLLPVLVSATAEVVSGEAEVVDVADVTVPHPQHWRLETVVQVIALLLPAEAQLEHRAPAPLLVRLAQTALVSVAVQAVVAVVPVSHLVSQLVQVAMVELVAVVEAAEVPRSTQAPVVQGVQEVLAMLWFILGNLTC